MPAIFGNVHPHWRGRPGPLFRGVRYPDHEAGSDTPVKGRVVR